MSVPGLALLVVDAQSVLLNAIPGGDALGDSCRFVAAAAHAMGIRTAFCEQRPDKLGGTRPDILAAAPGAPVFAKSTFSAFGEEGVAEWLREHEIAHVLVAGLETPICVYQTVLGAMAEGLDVTVLTDAVGGRRPEDHAAALRALEKKSECHLLPSEAIFYSILGDASHAAFKPVSALVKARDTGAAPAVVAQKTAPAPAAKKPAAKPVAQVPVKPSAKSAKAKSAVLPTVKVVVAKPAAKKPAGKPVAGVKVLSKRARAR